MLRRALHCLRALPLAVTSLTAVAAAPEPLTVSYIERPPFYMTEGGHAVGLVTEVARRVLTAAKIDHKFVSLAFDRILNDVRVSKAPLCTIGWHKTQEREQFARFSLPIYQSGPLGAVVLRAKEAIVGKHTTLKSLFGDRDLTLGLAKGFSYGDAVDGLVKTLQPRVVDTGPQHRQLLKMLARGRIAYMLASADEIAPMAAASSLDESSFALVPLSDVPPPEPRYFMCSKSVPESVIERLNAAIKADAK